MIRKTFEEMVKADPDKFDDFDCRPGPSTYPVGSAERIMPRHVREAIVARTKRAGGP